MDYKQAKTLIGGEATVTWLDRKGAQTTRTLSIFDVRFVPMYGPCLATDAGDISLERVVDLLPAAKAA